MVGRVGGDDAGEPGHANLRNGCTLFVLGPQPHAQTGIAASAVQHTETKIGRRETREKVCVTLSQFERYYGVEYKR
jgi:hypothetical protein